MCTARLVPCKKTFLYKLGHLLLEDHRLAIPAQWPTSAGRQPDLTVADVDALVELGTTGGRTLGSEDIAKALTQARQSRARSRGDSTVSTPMPHRDTVRNYRQLAASSPIARITFSAVEKTENRFTAENSLRSAMSFLLTVASTSIILGEPRTDMARPPPSCKLAAMVSDTCGGVPVSLVNPYLLTSTDDTTLFVFEGKTPDSALSWRIANKAESTSARAAYGGTFTLSAAGTIAPLYYSVTGLSDTELDPQVCSSGVLVVKIPGVPSRCCTGSRDLPRADQFPLLPPTCLPAMDP